MYAYLEALQRTNDSYQVIDNYVKKERGINYTRVKSRELGYAP